MLKRFLILVLIVAVGVLGLPAAGNAVQHGHSMLAMESCDCPPGHEMPGKQMPCQDNGGCDQMPGCSMHCSLAPVAVPASLAGAIDQVAAEAPQVAETPGIFLSSSYPPYRPPQI